MPDDTDRLLDADLGETTDDPGTPAGVVEVETDWEPPTDDETEGSDLAVTRELPE